MGRANEATKFLAVLQIVVDGFGREGYIFDPVYIYMYRKQIINIETHFVIILKVYNGDKGSTIAFHESRPG